MQIIQRLTSHFTSKHDLSFGELGIVSLMAAILGITGAQLLFPQNTDTVAVFITAILLFNTFDRLIAANADNIWGKRLTGLQANRLLALQFLTVFLVIVLTYLAFAYIVGPEETLRLFAHQTKNFSPDHISASNFADFVSIAKNNLTVLLISLIAALIFLKRGASLILTWNAVLWGVVFGLVIRLAPVIATTTSTLKFAAIFILGVLPHLALELAGYILISMAGIFFIKGITKYTLASAEFRQVMFAVVKISIVAITLVILGALAESQIAANVLQLILPQ